MKKGNVLDQQLGCVKAWDWSPEMRDPSFAFETFDAEALMGRQVTSHMSRVLASKSDWKKLVALSTAFIFLWSMCITPVMAETIKLEGGSVEVNVQDNTTNWKVQGNPVWNVPEFNVAQGSIYNIAGLGTGSSLALLVNGGSASNIFGTMNLFNLDFILQNIAGINIGRSAMINLNSASLIASTLPLNLSATDFLARNYQFSGQGAFLSNAGHIIGTNANLVALVSNTIENTGTIEVPMGTVALAAGNTVTVGISADGLVSIGVDEATANKLGLADQIKNSGTISAQGGKVVLNAKAVDGLFEKAINIAPGANATAVVKSDDGVIEFVAQGNILNQGTVQAKRGEIKMEATGDIETRGSLVASRFSEKAAAFKISGLYMVGISSHNNLDNAITYTGNTTVSGTIEDVDDIIINAGVTITLAGDTSFVADSDQNYSLTGHNTGAFTMGAGSSIDGTAGHHYNLSISASKVSHLYNIANVGSLTLGASRTGSNPSYVMHNAISTASDFTLNKGTATLAGGDLTVGGIFTVGEGAIFNETTDMAGANAYVAHFGSDDIVGTYRNVSNGTAAMRVASVSDLQAVRDVLDQNYVQTGDISGVGDFTNYIIGDGDTPFTGTFNGNGYTIDSLTLNTGADNVGLFGYTSGATIQNVGLIHVNVTGVSNVGGLVGHNSASSTIDNSYVEGDVVANGGDYGGGLVGDNEGTITNSYTSGSVSGGYYNIGGLAGGNYGGAIDSSHSSSSVSGQHSTGGLVGSNEGGSITHSYATGDVYGENYATGGLVGQNGYLVSGSIDNSYATGDVTSSGSQVGGLVGYSWGTTRGSISNSYATGDVSADGAVGGLVGVLNNEDLLNSYATGNVTGGSDVGGLVGLSLLSFVENSYAKGTVIGTDRVGGLVGQNEGTISKSYATANVNETGGGSTEGAGGLVGFNEGIISESYATGSVLGNYIAGGLVGWNSSTISNSYATGTVGGSQYAGGLVGVNDNLSQIDNSYATGLVNNGVGGANIGGFIGLSLSDAYAGNFWNQETTQQGYGTGAGDVDGITGKTTLPMEDVTTFTNAGWDFNGLWKINAGEAPHLIWQDMTYSTDFIGGTSAMPMQIHNVNELQFMKYELSSSFKLVQDIDASSTVGWNGGLGFATVGDINNYFTGTFDGQGHTITGLTINRSTGYPNNFSIPEYSDIGLFGRTEGAKISNVGLLDVNITGDLFVGGLVGWNGTGSSVTNSYVTGSVEGYYDQIGGLVGRNFQGAISNSYSKATVRGHWWWVGGLAGISDGGSITNSYAAGDVYDDVGGGTGGLLGHSGGSSISNSYAVGSVNGVWYVGGLIGYDGGGNAFANNWWWKSAGHNAGLNDTGTSGDLPNTQIATEETLSNFYSPAHAVYAIGAAGQWDIFTPIWDMYANEFPRLHFEGHNGNIYSVWSGASSVWSAASNWVGNALPGDNIFISHRTFDPIVDADVASSIVIINSGATLDLGSFSLSGVVTNLGTVKLVGDNISVSAITEGTVNYYGTGTYAGLKAGYDYMNLIFSGVGGTYTINNSLTTSGDMTIEAGTINQNAGLSIGGNFSQSGGTLNQNAGLSVFGGFFKSGGIFNNNAAITLAMDFLSLVGGTFNQNVAMILANYNQSGGAFNQNNNLFIGGDYIQTGGTFMDAAPLAHAFTVEGSFSLPYGTNAFRRYTGAGTTNDPFVIRNLYDLQGLKGNLTSNFKLNTSLDASSISGWNADAGFDPIGDATHAFTGTLSGFGKVISNLTMHWEGNDYVGLFGNIGVGGLVSELALEKVSSYGRHYVGGLAGLNEGTLSNVYTTGSFTVSGVNFVGGLVGGNTGSIANAYSSARVVGTDTVGGLAGFKTGTIQNTYAMGQVTGSSNTGGLVGTGTGTVANSFWSQKMTGQATSAGGTAGKVIGITTNDEGYAVPDPEDVADPASDMMSSGTFSGWDFGSTWVMDEGGSFPHFQFRFPEGVRGVWGVVYNTEGATTEAGRTVDLYVNTNSLDTTGLGTQVDTTRSTADGMYYFVMGANDVQAQDWVIGKLNGGDNFTGNTRMPAETGSIKELDIWGTLARMIPHPKEPPPIRIPANESLQEAQGEVNRSLQSLMNNTGQIASLEGVWGKASDVQIQDQTLSVSGIEMTISENAWISFYDESAPGIEPVPTFTLTHVGTETAGLQSGSTKSVMLEIAENLVQSPKGREASGSAESSSVSSAGGQATDATDSANAAAQASDESTGSDAAASPATEAADENADAAGQKALAADEQTDENAEAVDQAVSANDEQATESQTSPEKNAASSADRGAKSSSNFFGEEAKKFLTDVRVIDGVVYVVDSASEVSLLTPGESVRVLFKEQSGLVKARGTASVAGVLDPIPMPVKADPLPVLAVKTDPPPLMALKADPSDARIKADFSTVSVKTNPPETVEKVDLPVKAANVPPMFTPQEPKDIAKLGLFAVQRTTNSGVRYGTLKNPGKNVFVKCPGGEWQAAKEGMIILPGDEVRTAAQSSVEVLLDDGKVGQLKIQEGSLFRINKAETNPATEGKTTLLDLAIGKMLIKVGKLKGDSKFEVRTPTALTGVRGTVFEVTVKEKV